MARSRVGYKKHKFSSLLIFVFGLATFPSWAMAESTSITILHTNDLHSHFREDRGPLHLGGVARLKTAVQRVKNEVQNTLLVDAGDWSEGNVYYNEGVGLESVKMLDQIGYDVAVIGNHDWLNGPDILLGLFKQLNPKTTFVSANLNVDQYSQADEFKKRILPYTVKEIGGVKIAFIGFSTYAFIYDSFFAPVQITEPFWNARQLSAHLKNTGEANFVVALSHNSILTNQAILRAAPSIDLLISGHEHKKLTSPLVTNHLFYPSAWLVEAGCWGQYLGRVDLKVENGKVQLADYHLIQIDSSIPENPEVAASVSALEAQLETQYGPIFQDHVGESEVDLSRAGINNDMGNLVVDAYLSHVHADFALESTYFVAGAIHPGLLRTVDFLNMDPAIYSPTTQKSWTLKTLPILGKTLKWVLYILHTSQKVSSFGLINVSGLSYTFDPLLFMGRSQTRSMSEFNSNLNSSNINLSSLNLSESLLSIPEDFELAAESLPVVKNIKIQGADLDPTRVYQMALGDGLLEAIKFINSKILNVISLEGLQDSGIENWRLLAEYVRAQSPLTEANLPPRDHRIQTLQTDLGIYSTDIQWTPLQKTPQGMLAKIQVRVKNYGAQPFDFELESEAAAPPPGLEPHFMLPRALASSAENGAERRYVRGSDRPRVHLLLNRNAAHSALPDDWVEIEPAQDVEKLQPGETRTYTWEAVIPEAIPGLYPVTARVDESVYEVNTTNNEATRWLVETGI